MKVSPGGNREDVLVRAEAIRKAMSRADRMVRMGVAVALALIVALAVVALEALWPGSDWQRWCLALIVYGATGCAIVAALWTPAKRRRTRAGAAGDAERRVSGRDGQARAAVELAESQRPDSVVGQAMTDRAIAQGLARLQLFDLHTVVDRTPVRRALAAMLCSVAVVAMVWIASPRAISMSAVRVFDPLGDHPPYSSIRIAIHVVNENVRMGDDLSIEATVHGGGGNRVTLEYQIGDHTIERMALRLREESSASAGYRGVVRDVRDTVRIRAIVGDARTRWFTVDPSPTPRIRDARVVVTPPSYAGQRTREIEEWHLSSIQALVGSTIELFIELSMDVVRVDAPGTASSTMNGQTAHATWLISDEGPIALHLNVATTAGTSLDKSIEFEVKGVADEAPAIDVAAPRLREGELGAVGLDSSIPIRAMARDDYGLESFVAQWRVASASDNGPARWELIDQVDPLTDRLMRIETAVTPRAIGAIIGSRVEIQFVAEDQRPAEFGGALTTVVGPYSFQVVSEAQIASMAKDGDGATAVNSDGESVHGEFEDERVAGATEDDASNTHRGGVSASDGANSDGTLRGEGARGGEGGRSSTQGGSDSEQTGAASADGNAEGLNSSDYAHQLGVLDALSGSDGDASGLGFDGEGALELAPIESVNLNRLPERYREAVIRYYEWMTRSRDE